MPSMCRHYVRHRDMWYLIRRGNLMNGREANRIPQSDCQLPGVGNAAKDTPDFLRLARVSLKQREGCPQGMARKSWSGSSEGKGR